MPLALGTVPQPMLSGSFLAGTPNSLQDCASQHNAIKGDSNLDLHSAIRTPSRTGL